MPCSPLQCAMNSLGLVKEDERSCIICVGSTGAGKSSTVTKVTGVLTRSGSGTDRVTRHCHIIRTPEPGGDVWVDTMGWDDAEVEDEETFKDILRFINKHDITRVRCIIWNILPNIRKDALLKKQAELINLFKAEDIWRNVVIVAKQSLTPAEDCAGAVRAAEELSREWPVVATGYRFLSDPSLSPAQRDLMQDAATRKTFNVKTDSEVRETLTSLMDRLGPPVQVVFNTSRCVDCSMVGDSRLFSKFCHMEPHMIHPGTIEPHHPGAIEDFHPSQHHILEHDGRLKKFWYSNFLCGTLRKARYSCCRRRQGKEGCSKKWGCCRTEVEQKGPGCSRRHKCCGADPSFSPTGCSSRWSCCGGPVTGSEAPARGCRKVCKRCGVDWGLPAGQCYVREHNLVLLEEEKENNQEDIEEPNDTDILLAYSKQVKPVAKSSTSIRKRKIVEMLERYPPVITYHIF